MKKHLLTLLVVAVALSSCSKRTTGPDDPNNGGDPLKGAAPLTFIGAAVSDTKTSTDLTAGVDKKTTFTDQDQVGIFGVYDVVGTSVTPKPTQYPETPYGYQFQGSESDATKQWKAIGSSLIWKDLITANMFHDFYSFYPYNPTSRVAKVVPPSIADQVHSDVDITLQDFKLIDLIAPFDFLVAARQKTGYDKGYTAGDIPGTSPGVAKSAGQLDLKYKHALSLIEVKVIRSEGAFNSAGSTPYKHVEIKRIMVTAPGLTAKRTGNFLTGAIPVAAGANSTWDFDLFWSKGSTAPGTVGIDFMNLKSVAGVNASVGKGPQIKPFKEAADATTDNATSTPAKFYFVTYPTPANTTYQFEINAMTVKDDNTDFVREFPLAAETKVLNKLEPGKKYTFTVKISDRALTVLDLTISDWVDGNLGGTSGDIEI